MKMHFGQTSLFSAAFFSFSTLLLADSVPHAAVMSPTAEDDVRVVVSATRGWAQDPLDVPQAVSVLSADVLNERVYSSLEAALQRLPNMGLAQAGQPYSTSQGANTSSNYWQEGFSIRGLGGPRVLVLTDGVRQAGQGIGYGGGNLSLYDFYAIERVEVLRGPASVMYGTDAFGGVVSVTTREPSHRAQFGLGGKARISFDGSRNMWRTGGYINAGDKNFACVVGASTTEAKNPHAPKGATIDGGAFKSYGAWLKADYLLNEKSRIRFLANTTQVQDIKVADRDIKHPKLSMHLNVEIPLYSRSEVGVEWVGSDLSEKVEEAKVGFFWQGLHRHFHWDAPRFVHKPIMREDRSVRTTNDRANTFELQPMMRFNFEPHTLIIGADIARDDVKLQDQRNDHVYRFLTLEVDPLNHIGKQTVNQSSTVADAYQYRVGFYARPYRVGAF